VEALITRARFALALSILLFWQAGSASPDDSQAERAPGVHAPGPDYRPPEGLLLRYKAEWHLLNAGVVTLRMERGPDGAEHVTGTAESIGVVAKLYHAHDIFQSSYDPKTFCSMGIIKHTEEGSRRRETAIHFDYQHGKSTVEELNANKNQRRHWEDPIPACVLDVLTTVYYTASVPLDPGTTFSFPINDGAKTANLDVSVTSHEPVSVEAGDFKTTIVETQPASEIMKNRGKVWVWFSDGPLRIPVKIRGRLRWGTVTLTLQSIEHPSTAAAKR